MTKEQTLRAVTALMELAALIRELDHAEALPLQAAMVRHLKGAVREWEKSLTPQE